MIRLFVLFLFFLMNPAQLFAQTNELPEIPVDSDSLGMKVQTINQDTFAKDSIATDSLRKLSRAVKSVFFKNGNEVFSDSLMRWNVLQTFPEYVFWNDALRVNRTESTIRSAQISTSSQQSLAYYVDGFRLRSPFSGTFNANFLPLKEMKSLFRDGGRNYYLETKRYYQIKPRTILDMEESGFGYLDVYGNLTIPFKQNHILDLGLWNRSEDGEFLNGQTQAKLMEARYRLQFSDSKAIDFSVNYTSNQMREPDGYQIEPIEKFDFNRFTALPNRQKAYSSLRNALYRIDYQDETAFWAKHALLFINLNRRFVRAPKEITATSVVFPADTVDLGYQELGLQASSSWNLITAEWSYLLRTSVLKSNQSILSDAIKPSFDGLFWWNTQSLISYRNKSEIFPLEISQNFDFNTLTGLDSSTDAALRYQNKELFYGVRGQFSVQRQPIYTKYARSMTLNGKSLPSAFYIGAGTFFGFDNQTTRLYLSFDAGRKNGDYGFDGTNFVLMEPFQLVQSELEASWKWKKFSISNSTQAAYRFSQSEDWDVNLSLVNKSGLFHEDYWFNKATFVKMGFRFIVNPFYSQPYQYLLMTDEWLPIKSGGQIPGFMRLDYELSARVRQLFITIRWENLTQGTITPGYFETYPYPMYSRRLRFGVKVYFTD